MKETESVFWSVTRWSLGFTGFVGVWLFGGKRPEWAFPFVLGSLLVIGDLMLLVKGLEITLGPAPEKVKRWVHFGMVLKYVLLIAVIYLLARVGAKYEWNMIWLVGGVAVFPLMTLLKALGMMLYRREKKAVR